MNIINNYKKMSSKITIEDLQDNIPVMQDAYKNTNSTKTALEKLMNITNFTQIESYFVENVFEVIIDRTDDKPQVSEKLYFLGKRNYIKIINTGIS